MKLSEYLSKHDISAADFAREIGVNTWTVNRYRNQARIPDKATMLKIKQVTNGEITADSFYK